MTCRPILILPTCCTDRDNFHLRYCWLVRPLPGYCTWSSQPLTRISSSREWLGFWRENHQHWLLAQRFSFMAECLTRKTNIPEEYHESEHVCVRYSSCSFGCFSGSKWSAQDQSGSCAKELFLLVQCIELACDPDKLPARVKLHGLFFCAFQITTWAPWEFSSWFEEETVKLRAVFFLSHVYNCILGDFLLMGTNYHHPRAAFKSQTSFLITHGSFSLRDYIYVSPIVSLISLHRTTFWLSHPAG